MKEDKHRAIQARSKLQALKLLMAMAISATSAPSALFSDLSHRRQPRFLVATTSERRRLLLQIRSYKDKAEHQQRRSFLPMAASSAQTSSPENTKIDASEDLANNLKGVEVLDLNGNATSIVELWRERKAVVAFARHFGCVLCRKRADLLASKKDLMDAAGVALVLIGPGSVDQAKAFAQQTKFQGEVYADPNHSSFNALKFVSGISTTFTPLAGIKIVQSYMEGYRQDWGLSFEKDTMSKGGWQQGGILIAGPGIGNIIYLHKDKEAGDDPDIEEIVRACCAEPTKL